METNTRTFSILIQNVNLSKQVVQVVHALSTKNDTDTEDALVDKIIIFSRTLCAVHEEFSGDSLPLPAKLS